MTTQDLVKLQTAELEELIKKDAAHPCVNQMLWNLKLLLECQKIEAEVTLTLAQAKNALDGGSPIQASPRRIWPNGTVVFITKEGKYTVDPMLKWDIAGSIAFVDSRADNYAVDTRMGERFRIPIKDLS